MVRGSSVNLKPLRAPTSVVFWLEIGAGPATLVLFQLSTLEGFPSRPWLFGLTAAVQSLAQLIADFHSTFLLTTVFLIF